MNTDEFNAEKNASSLLEKRSVLYKYTISIGHSTGHKPLEWAVGTLG